MSDTPMTSEPTTGRIDEPVSDEKLREILDGCEGVTEGPYDVWREPTPIRADAIAELTAQVEQSEPFAEAIYLLNAGGKCPATTGCGPKSAKNAAHFGRLDPAMVRSIVSELLARRSSSPVSVGVTEEKVEAAAREIAPHLWVDLPHEQRMSDDYAFTNRREAQERARKQARAALEAAAKVRSPADAKGDA